MPPTTKINRVESNGHWEEFTVNLIRETLKTCQGFLAALCSLEDKK